MFLKTTIERALGEPARSGARLEHALTRAARQKVTKKSEAELIVQCLRFFPLATSPDSERRIGSPLHDALTLFQNVDNNAAVAVFRTRGMPELYRIYRAVRKTNAAATVSSVRDDLLFLCKQLVAYDPSAAQDEDFRAMAEFCDWLAHPMEVGRPPDEIELKD